MATPVTVAQFSVRGHDNPDEVRTPPKTRVEVVNLSGYTIGRLTFDPGWKWSEAVKPIVKTDSCQLSHVGYVISGSITIHLPDGSQQVIKAGDSYTIPPGHDGWVNGNEPCVCIEVLSASEFAKA